MKCASRFGGLLELDGGGDPGRRLWQPGLVGGLPDGFVGRARQDYPDAGVSPVGRFGGDGARYCVMGAFLWTLVRECGWSRLSAWMNELPAFPGHDTAASVLLRLGARQPYMSATMVINANDRGHIDLAWECLEEALADLEEADHGPWMEAPRWGGLNVPTPPSLRPTLGRAESACQGANVSVSV